MDILSAKQSLDKVISKGRVHLYKPIQVAEILHRDRVDGDIDLAGLETYRNASKKWRNEICLRFLGRRSTSSARYQDDIFNANAVPPQVMVVLGQENRAKNGIVEAYIYSRFAERFTQMSTALQYCLSHNRNDFRLDEFIALFWNRPGLRRSIDKIYEIVVYALFSSLVECLNIKVRVSYDSSKADILHEFEEFAERVLCLSPDRNGITVDARIHRVGVTNAADRGLDMWANFGMAIQIKHLSLTEELAENIVSSVSSDRIVIVCKDSEEKVIISLLNQIGWRSKIQSIITEKDLEQWYEKALRGKYAAEIGDMLLSRLENEIQVEFPATDGEEFAEFQHQRGYGKLKGDTLWDIY